MTRRPIIPLVPPRPDLDSSNTSVPDSSPMPSPEMQQAYIEALRFKPAPPQDEPDEPVEG